ncbi:hypothetical protein GCM10027034_45190 [Ramlibacter solisilvae]|uniref:Uncharacterized protein n=1 Tax=Ramlibacter tataouinensis TaxID=94132 RepID=A0A127JT02_9BURK|nr:PhaM family polyhydroxyalkanoate granule multifunctional regulatory protein [Ramlibacter tataouinensis]AMO23050.1 hypothetical protein UC35_09295 [Ramlibacter tataouinensis]
MSDPQNLGFGKFVPGFDFLQNLAKGASHPVPQMPNLSSWVAPTLSVEELEKRISELKAVHFWLDQNSKALGATIQALEVQKMTLATLKGMNVNMAEMANAMTLKAADMFGGMQKMGEKATDAAAAAAAQAPAKSAPAKPARKPAAKASSPSSTSTSASAGKGDGAAAAGVIDPLQWWGSLTQQFQQIASTALKDVAAQSAFDSARKMATGAAAQMATEAVQEAAKSTGATAKATKATTGHTSARKTAARRTGAKTTRR